MGKFNNSVICSYQTLTEVTGYSRPTVARAIKHLKEHKWIDTVKVGSATAYCVNAQVAWRCANNQRHYAIFTSTVVASSSENSDFNSDKKLRNIPTELNTIDYYIKQNMKEIQEIDEIITLEDQIICENYEFDPNSFL